MSAIVETINLCKTYGKGDAKVEALKNCSITIEKGEIVSIIGASGSGKSTLLHLLGTLDTPTSGEIIFNGKSLTDKSDNELSVFRRRNMGFVFQNYNLVPELTAEENIKLPLMLDKKSEDNEYMEKIIEMLDLKGRLSHLPGQLSGGQQQRVAIARAIINKPAVVYCDEPTGNLDSKSGAEVMKLLLYLSAQLNITQVIVTHDMNVAAQTHRAIKIIDGKVEGGV